jgi:long-subunit acyl-CoA synthetase (AMP-forming)
MSYIRASNEIRVSDVKRCCKISRSDGDHDPLTIPDVFDRVVENYGDNPALAYLDNETKRWIFLSYKQYKEKVDKYAKIFIKLGLKRYGSIAVLAFNSVEWFITELATIHAG